MQELARASRFEIAELCTLANSQQCASAEFSNLPASQSDLINAYVQTTRCNKRYCCGFCAALSRFSFSRTERFHAFRSRSLNVSGFGFFFCASYQVQAPTTPSARVHDTIDDARVGSVGASFRNQLDFDAIGRPVRRRSSPLSVSADAHLVRDISNNAYIK